LLWSADFVVAGVDHIGNALIGIFTQLVMRLEKKSYQSDGGLGPLLPREIKKRPESKMERGGIARAETIIDPRMIVVA